MIHTQRPFHKVFLWYESRYDVVSLVCPGEFKQETVELLPSNWEFIFAPGCSVVDPYHGGKYTRLPRNWFTIKAR